MTQCSGGPTEGTHGAEAKREIVSAHVQRAFLDACLLDVMAMKPGNVGVHGAGHGMSRSTSCAAPGWRRRPSAGEEACVGERIHGASRRPAPRSASTPTWASCCWWPRLRMPRVRCARALTGNRWRRAWRRSLDELDRGRRAARVRGDPSGQSRRAGRCRPARRACAGPGDVCWRRCARPRTAIVLRVSTSPGTRTWWIRGWSASRGAGSRARPPLGRHRGLPGVPEPLSGFARGAQVRCD